MKELRTLAIILTLIMLIQPLAVSAAQGDGLDEGVYIVLGAYEDNDLVWQVIDIDEEGLATLFCHNIIDFMAFDAAESGTYGQGAGVDAYGSNTYANSNIFEWLNSREPSVSYTTAEPTRTSLQSFMDNDEKEQWGLLSDESGFLTAFTNSELDIMVEWDMGISNQIDLEIGSYPKVYPETSDETVTARVGLLSIEEMDRMVLRKGFDVAKETFDGNGEYYWLRTPDKDLDVLVATMSPQGAPFKTTASYSYTGIVPVVKIDAYRYPTISGDGSSEAPYVLDYSYVLEVDNMLLSDERSLIQEAVRQYLSGISEMSTTAQKEVVARSMETEIYGARDPHLWKLSFEAYIAEAGVGLHRRLFSQAHLLRGELGSGVEYSDLQGLPGESEEAIMTLSALGVVNGYEDGSFRLNGFVTRAEAAKILTLTTMTHDQLLTRSFDDVTYGDWHFSYVESAKVNGFIQGYGDGSFRPGSNVSYDEMSAIISRVLTRDYGFYSKASDAWKTILPEGSSASAWADTYVSQLAMNGILTGDQVYDGQAKATREDVMVMMNRLYELIYE